jgi:NAD-dependent SIR2 family protein deacetylase
LPGQADRRQNPPVRTARHNSDRAGFLHNRQRIFVLTGAGCSTPSGIPAYRDERGDWMRRQPITWQAFRGDPQARQRYWARSMVGWQAFGRANPNPAHHALAALERAGRLSGLVTQNVDGLHQAAGHRQVIDLHGRLDTVLCVECGTRTLRRKMQERLLQANPGWLDLVAEMAPDGDADLEGVDFACFSVPACERCQGLLKPDVVLFGENVPGERVRQTMSWLEQSDALLIVGSSLRVFSGFRYARKAAELGLPIAAINRGHTRADELIHVKVEDCCSHTLIETLELIQIKIDPAPADRMAATTGLV